MTGLGLWIAVLIGGFAADNASDTAQLLAGEDLHMQAKQMWTCRQTQTPDEHVLLFENGFSMSIGDNQLSAEKAVVWLKDWGRGQLGFESQTYYQAEVYLEDNVSFHQGKRARTTSLDQLIVQDRQNLVVRFLVTGQVFVTADEQKEMSCQELLKQELYQRAGAKASTVHEGPSVAQGALVPGLRKSVIESGEPTVVGAAGAAASDVMMEPAGESKKKEPVFTYPVHISAVWDPEPVIERTPSAEGDAVTVSGRFYLWRRQSANSLLEFQADSAVLFFQSGQFDVTRKQGGRDLAQGRIESAYLRGNIVMTEGERTIRANEIYYDFIKKQAVVVNAAMRMFDEKRGLPIYLSAQRLRQVSDSFFQAEKITLTSSEFYLPQLSANASRMVVMKEETAEQLAETADRVNKTRQAQTQAQTQGKGDNAAKYYGTMYDVNMKYYNQKVFGWPKINSRFVRPELPISKLAIGNDSEYGTSVETRWYLYRLLGWKEPAGMDTRLAADYFSKRGVGTGIESEYEFENSFGNVIGYIMSDRGKDDLGRADNLRNQDPGQDIRGRFGVRHREYLPDDWQATMEIGYISDRNFLEWMYRDEFNTDKGQETLLHLKQQRDNWALSLLGKARINDFESMTEELPSIEYHRTGQSFWDHQLTWYSDSRISRLRDRYDEELSGHPGEDFYTFGSTRNEVDWPFMLGTVKLSPFVAGTYAYEDQNGYDLSLSGRDTGRNDTALLGEGGLRASTMFWKEDLGVHSRLWDLDGIRHILMPHVEAAAYGQNEAGIDQRNVFNAGLSQRWQTHRGQGEDRRSVDWLRWDVDSTWLDRTVDSDIGPKTSTDYFMYGPLAGNGAGSTYGPSKFIFSDSSIPVFLRRNDRYFGMVRNSINSDAEWRVTDTTALLGDINYDVQSGVVQQLDLGMSRYVYPDLSLYLGSRYLRPIIVDAVEHGKTIHEEGSHSVVGAVTYKLGERYWVTASQEYNFDFGKSISSNFALIRQYHRLFYSLEASFDQSLNRKGVMFSIWPQGVKELSLGSRRYTGLVGARTEQ